MTTQTLTLTEFLLARIAEDEDLARHVWPERYTDRMLAECAAKRAIVELHQEILDEDDGGNTVELGCGECTPTDRFREGQPWPCATLCALASVYADHPDYRSEWAS